MNQTTHSSEASTNFGTRAAYVVASVGLLYSLVHAIGRNASLCQSLGCTVLQHKDLWWVGSIFSASLIMAIRFRPSLVKLLVIMGLVGESILVFYQAILGLYCVACLGFTAIFILFVVMAPGIGGGRKFLLGIMGIVAFLVFTLLASLPRLRVCRHIPYCSVSAAINETSLIFEPSCVHCQSVLDLVRRLGLQKRIALCPQAWSLRSLHRLLKNQCPDAPWNHKIRCFVTTLAIIRENNTFCAQRGLTQVPLLITHNRIIPPASVVAFLEKEAGNDDLLNALTHDQDSIGEACTPWNCQ